MKARDEAVLEERRARIVERLDPRWQEEMAAPMFGGTNLRYEMAARVEAIPCGGIGLIQEFVRSIGLAEAIDERVDVLKRHFPYHESDHILNMTYNILAGGTRLEDLDRLRNNEAYLDTLGSRRIPDPTTAGDFLRRFKEEDVMDLMGAINIARVRVWQRLAKKERQLALIDTDGTIAPTTGECKEGMDISYKGTWGYAPLVVTLANTQEVLFVKNRPGNQPSHSGAVAYMDAAVALVRQGGFKRVRLRGDTDFSLTKEFDRWDDAGVEFVFGIDAHPSFVKRANALPETAWQKVERTSQYAPTGARERPENVKERIVVERGYTNLVLEDEHIAEITYTPSCSDKTYRMIVLRKIIRAEKHQQLLFRETRYHFYVANVTENVLSTRAVVAEANARCNQENLIEQLKNGVQGMRMASDGLVSNWAYLVIAALAWNLKAWLAICWPAKEQRRELRRMEFRRFLHTLMLLPCQVVKTARRVVLRILTYSPWARVLPEGIPFFRRQRFA
jgi:hypothetical protein